MFLESEYLSDYATTAGADYQGESRAHFEIICVQGRFDIVALSFSFSLFNEIPYVEDPRSED